MPAPPSHPQDAGGYVLAGGKSSRMGQEKALLDLGGRPLIAHAVEKLRQICADVHILSANEALAVFAPLVPDLHPGCGPLGGIEAALAHSRHAWNLIYPVDVPFIPAQFLASSLEAATREQPRGVRMRMYNVAGRPQPTLLVIHTHVLPFIAEAVRDGRYKLFPVLQAAGEALDAMHATAFGPARLHALQILACDDATIFANVNTPDDLAEARRRLPG